MSENTVSMAFSVARDAYKDFRTHAESLMPVVSSIVWANLVEKRDVVDRLESRLKDFESIRDNYVVDRGIPTSPVDLGDFLQDAKDLLGVRIVVYRNRDVDAVCTALNDLFIGTVVEEKNTERDISRGARFGYRAVHLNFVFQTKGLLKKDLSHPLYCEIQIRTILSDAWSRHSHKFIYKGKSRPSEKLIRDFASTAALLEAVDDRIDTLEKHAVDTVRTALSVELDRQQVFDQISALTSESISEASLLSFFLEFEEREIEIEGSSKPAVFLDLVTRAWSRFGGLNYTRYGVIDPVQKIRTSLFGADRKKFSWVLPLHARERWSQVIDNFESSRVE